MSDRMARNKDSDWNEYYSVEKYKIPPFIINALWSNFVMAVKRHLAVREPLVIVELGGANSCFYGKIKQSFNVREYHILDNNRLGLDLFPHKMDPGVHLHEIDLLKPGSVQGLGISADLVLSLGLIEHFEPDETSKLVRVHFELTAPGGLVLITFPTPTLIYKGFRAFLESIGRFPPLYERPLRREEIEPLLERDGNTLEFFRIWRTILTQFLTCTRKSE